MLLPAALMAVCLDVFVPVKLWYPHTHGGGMPVASGEVRDKGKPEGLGAESC